MSSADIGENFKEVQARVLELNPKALLVGVSKTKPIEDLQAAYDAGCRVFGENRVEEIIEKAPRFPDAKFHLIGHLQTNKVAKLCKFPNVDMIHTVDSQHLADKLNNTWPEDRQPLKILIQVNTSQEPQKCGINGSAVFELADYIIKNCPHLKFAGLMTIGEIGEASRDFQALIDARTECAGKLNVPPETLELSMGMSADYELALQMGATIVRVGSTIFGARNYSI